MKKGQIVYTKIENIPCILIKITERLWASTYSIIPLTSGIFYTAGNVDIVLEHEIKTI